MNNKRFKDFCTELFGLRFNSYEELHDWLVINKANDARCKTFISIISDYIFYFDEYNKDADDGLLRARAEDIYLNPEECNSILYWLSAIGFKIYIHGVDESSGNFWVEVGVPKLDVTEDYSTVPEFINFIINKFSGREMSWVTSFAVTKFLTWFLDGEDITTDELCDSNEYSANEYRIADDGDILELEQVVISQEDFEDAYGFEVKEKIKKYMELGHGSFTTNVQWGDCAELDYFRRLLKSMLSYVGAISECETVHRITTVVPLAEDCDYLDDDDYEAVTTHTVMEIYKPIFNN